MAVSKESLHYITKEGRAIAELFDPLAELRIAVFRDFPYLYEGSAEYEKTYLQTYVKSEQSMLFGVYDGAKMVGATTCLPLRDEMPELQAPFIESGYDLDRIIYFGESLLLPEYRGLGLGHRFFDEREAHAQRLALYRTTCFCAVERDEHHPDRPVSYRSNDSFWQKRGYRKVPSLQATLDWPDIGKSESTPKTMTFWLRDL
ncbi:GNAT family N-acetyltransferase [Telluribacter humicola]|uniref:GNAT family N-acetyltransferase n=1 Tax=Telluribacter humicola TaxID=1720261 RepID=UPI001A95F88D|nr:GNAT family N-acetyltransferase [Telluribacter humicola]